MVVPEGKADSSLVRASPFLSLVWGWSDLIISGATATLFKRVHDCPQPCFRDLFDWEKRRMTTAAKKSQRKAGKKAESQAEEERREQRERAHLERVNLKAAGIDVGARSHFVAVPADLSDEPVREFAGFTGDLHRLADWPEDHPRDPGGRAGSRAARPIG